MENIEEREKIDDVPTRIEMIRSGHIEHRSAQSTDHKLHQNLIRHNLICHIRHHRQTRNVKER